MALVLDRYFVHRLRLVAGKDGNPVNDVELIADSLMNNDGVLRGNKVIKLNTGQSVAGLDVGDRIRLRWAVSRRRGGGRGGRAEYRRRRRSSPRSCRRLRRR